MIKVKGGPLFKRISKAMNYYRLGKEKWEKLKKGESVELEPLKELVEKGYLIEEKKQKKGDK
ncbi:MAG: hypothetical protein Tp1111SUR768151_10 [Prokaryotic dsDNA virus sp.]|nr:MAG: hypothetical protein Tp1111SUR768151_10 [Prokaryotic dsDNA virus sp.]|tara:strand:+ start:3503 stop:3688 length:186 start_codon:yes stop_codon:yes gene_type:complete